MNACTAKRQLSIERLESRSMLAARLLAPPSPGQGLDRFQLDRDQPRIRSSIVFISVVDHRELIPIAQIPSDPAARGRGERFTPRDTVAFDRLVGHLDFYLADNLVRPERSIPPVTGNAGIIVPVSADSPQSSDSLLDNAHERTALELAPPAESSEVPVSLGPNPESSLFPNAPMALPKDTVSAITIRTAPSAARSFASPAPLLHNPDNLNDTESDTGIKRIVSGQNEPLFEVGFDKTEVNKTRGSAGTIGPIPHLDQRSAFAPPPYTVKRWTFDNGLLQRLHRVAGDADTESTDRHHESTDLAIRSWIDGSTGMIDDIRCEQTLTPRVASTAANMVDVVLDAAMGFDHNVNLAGKTATDDASNGLRDAVLAAISDEQTPPLVEPRTQPHRAGLNSWAYGGVAASATVLAIAARRRQNTRRLAPEKVPNGFNGH